MPWRGAYRKTCKRCERERETNEMFSRRGKCPDCGIDAMVENNLQLRIHDGPYFEHWRRRSIAAYGGIPAEDLTA